MKKLIIIFIMSGIGSTALASESECLSRILYAESRGQSIEGVISVGQAAVEKARKEHLTLCKLNGVNRKTPIKELAEYYLLLAKHLVLHPSKSVSLGADHWNTGKKPALPGKVTRQIEGHVLYIMQAKAE
jgi:hypothetical protein